MSDNANKTGVALVVLRLSLALFLLPWVIEKFTKPEQTTKIFSSFYHIDIPLAGSYVVGVIWVSLLLAFVTGFKKRISYGLALIFHGGSTLSTIPQMLPFLETYNHLFLAAIPVLGGFAALYMMRDDDTLWTISK